MPLLNKRPAETRQTGTALSAARPKRTLQHTAPGGPTPSARPACLPSAARHSPRGLGASGAAASALPPTELGIPRGGPGQRHGETRLRPTPRRPHLANDHVVELPAAVGDEHGGGEESAEGTAAAAGRPRSKWAPKRCRFLLADGKAAVITSGRGLGELSSGCSPMRLAKERRDSKAGQSQRARLGRKHRARLRCRCRHLCWERFAYLPRKRAENEREAGHLGARWRRTG